ncbi:MAG: MarR family transcriptional regulator [Rhodospirillaceae bacterium]|nr:MarR family transcriptional regulator [Rhodospirillaceae bacterium]
MADINNPVDSNYLREEELSQAIEMLFFAYRDFTREPYNMLAKIDLGHAHHRAIYFVGRNSGTTVTELLAILKITKQSLARVLSQLVREGYFLQNTSAEDRRKRLLKLTQKGIELERELTANQRKRIATACKTAGLEAVTCFKNVLQGIMDDGDRWRFETRVKKSNRATIRRGI